MFVHPPAGSPTVATVLITSPRRSTSFNPTKIVTMDPEMKEKYAQEKYGKSFEELSTNEQKGVGGALRGGDLADPDRAPPPPEVKFGEDNPKPSAPTEGQQ